MSGPQLDTFAFIFLLLNVDTQLRSLSAQTQGGGSYGTAKSVEIIRAWPNIPPWHIRRGVAVGAKVAP